MKTKHDTQWVMHSTGLELAHKQ